jgi:hypothetical protein
VESPVPIAGLSDGIGKLSSRLKSSRATGISNLSNKLKKGFFSLASITSPMIGKLRAIDTLGDQSHRTAKAIAWIRTNYAKPLRVEELTIIFGR